MAKKYKRFFLNGNLHRVIHINRSRNELTAYDFIDQSFKLYPYSEVERSKQNALTMEETARVLGRSKDTIKTHMEKGNIPVPQREHSIKTKKPGKYFFSEDDVMGVRDFLSTLHYGRARKDGRVTPLRVPTREELRTMIQSGRILYVKENDEFVPIWRAQDW